MKAETAKTKLSAMKTMHSALSIIKENGGSMPRKELLEQMQEELKFEDWELERYPSNGQLKWLTIFLFYTIDCIKAGWLIKHKGGLWSITPEGEKALQYSPEKLFQEAGKAYRSWSNSREEPAEIAVVTEREIEGQSEKTQKVSLWQFETQANESVRQYLQQMKEYDFQHLCALLLKAMGYYINYEAQPGKDGGIDIIAFRDPLGFEKPRIKVQAKRYQDSNKVDVKPIREFKGLLHKGEDIGIFISSGYFTRDAEEFARLADVHIKLINREELIKLWIENSSQLDEDEKSMLPLIPIYFVGTEE